MGRETELFRRLSKYALMGPAAVIVWAIPGTFDHLRSGKSGHGKSNSGKSKPGKSKPGKSKPGKCSPGQE